MSTDATETSPLPPEGYDVIEHRNSNNSRRKGLVGWVIGKMGKPEYKQHTTYQVIRRLGGIPLPHSPTRPSRSKYAPHVGAKQLAKLS